MCWCPICNKTEGLVCVFHLLLDLNCCVFLSRKTKYICEVCLCMHERNKRVFFTSPHGCADAEECFTGVKHDVQLARGQTSPLCVNLSQTTMSKFTLTVCILLPPVVVVVVFRLKSCDIRGWWAQNFQCPSQSCHFRYEMLPFPSLSIYRGHCYQFIHLNDMNILIAAAPRLPRFKPFLFSSQTRLLRSFHLHIAEEVVLCDFNFQISWLIRFSVCCSSNGWSVGGLVGGWATESALDLHLYEPMVSLSPSQMCAFSQVLVVPKLCVYNRVCVCVCVCMHVWY